MVGVERLHCDFLDIWVAFGHIQCANYRHVVFVLPDPSDV